MLSSQPHYDHHSSVILRRQHHPYPSSFTSLRLPFAVKPTDIFSISSSSTTQHQETVQTPQPITTSAHEHHRKHNAKSTHLLRRHLEPHFNLPQQQQEEEKPINKLLELSLSRKRTPQFPGSIFSQSPSDVDVNFSLPPIRKLLDDSDSVDDEEVIMRALEIRRNVTLEIFKEAMKKGKFGITYSANLASRLPDFIDFVMIQAASMKNLPQFSHSSFNFRARNVIDSSNVVPLIRWLKHNELSYPQIGKLICKSRGNLDSIRRTAEWLKSIHVRGRSIGVVLTKAEGNIMDRSIEELNEIVYYLESNGVRWDWMGCVMSRCPELLCFNIEEVKIRSEFYLDMGMNENEFGTMVYDYPRVLGSLSLEEMYQKVGYLKEFGLSNEDVGRLLAFRPQLMGCSIEERWKPLVKYLYYLGISRDGMRRILTIKPMVFCVELESNIVPKVQFLRDIGVQDDAVGSVLVKFPNLLTYSLYKKIRPVVIFLLTKAGVSRRDIGKVIALGPELLGCSIPKKLDPNVKYFLSLGINLRVLGEMITDFPMLLRYNIDVLRPKYQYLRRTMVRPLKDLIEFPRFFSYSLESRIIPRYKVMVENRVNFKLRYMLRSTDEEFDQRIQAAVERRRKFELGVIDDNASESQADELGIIDDQASKSQADGRVEDILVDTCGHDHLSSDVETIEHSFELETENL